MNQSTAACGIILLQSETADQDARSQANNNTRKESLNSTGGECLFSTQSGPLADDLVFHDPGLAERMRHFYPLA